jgi:hypothetical protein
LGYADSSETPEDLTAILFVEDETPEKYDQAYLLIFELWRRLLPDKRCLSIFCDELDHQIEEYDRGLMTDEEPLLAVLKELEDLLDESVDDGADPKQVFGSVASYCAHDLENFLYDYITDQIDAGNETTASELLDGFYDYIPDQKWFDFLRVRLFFSTDPEDANILLRRLFDTLQETPDINLQLEMVGFLAHTGEPHQFVEAMIQSLRQLKSEQDFQDLIVLTVDYYRLLDNEKESEFFSKLLQKRQKLAKDQTLAVSDPDLKEFIVFFTKLSAE